MSKANPRAQGNTGVEPGTVLMITIMALVFGGGVAIAAIHTLAAKLTGQPTPEEVTFNPLGMIITTIKGEVEWTTPAKVIGIAMAVVVVAVGFCGWIFLSSRKPKTQIDKAAKSYLSANSDVESLSKKKATVFAEKNFTDPAVHAHPGLKFGHVIGKKSKGLYSTWEDLYLVIFGPRMGKTTTQVIPAIVDAPGPVVTTSNKRDIVDDTIGVTGARGTVWVFDPQDIAAGTTQQRWYFDPLDTIRRDPMTMDAAASALADIFLCASRGADSGGDEYFTNAGKDLLSRTFLAATLSNRPLTDVFAWINDESDSTPVDILDGSPEWHLQAKALAATYGLTEKTRSGVFSQAQQMASVLGRRSASRWVTPQPGAKRFSAYDFVRSSHDTLYLLSKEGPANAAALTTALVAAVMEEAERYGEECGGRLPVPLVAPLDETANVVRWPELPKLYSHYGSRSIILMTILQSYAQGVGVWGEHGMEALWSAASIMLYGGGVRDEKMLNKLEALIGEAAVRTTSTSSSRDGRSTSTSFQEQKILNVAELASMPAGRVAVFAAKRRPLMVATEPFWQRSWDASIRQHLAIKE